MYRNQRRRSSRSSRAAFLRRYIEQLQQQLDEDILGEHSEWLESQIEQAQQQLAQLGYSVGGSANPMGVSRKTWES